MPEIVIHPGVVLQHEQNVELYTNFSYRIPQQNSLDDDKEQNVANELHILEDAILTHKCRFHLLFRATVASRSH